MKVNDITARMNIDPGRKKHILEVATGRRKADLVLKNATWVNVFCNDLGHGDIAVAEGCIAGIGGEYHGETEIDVSGRIVLPGFIDAHIHLESSLVQPSCRTAPPRSSLIRTRLPMSWAQMVSNISCRQQKACRWTSA